MSQSTTQSPLLRLLRYTRPHRREISLASLLSVLNKVFDLAPPVLIGAAIDVVDDPATSFLAQLGIADVGDQLIVLGALTLIVWILESIFEYTYAVKWRNLAQEVEHELRLDAYSHVQELDLAYYEDRSTGGLMAILNDDVNQLERFLDIGANDLIQVSTSVILIGALFFVTAPEVAWWAVLPMPFIVWGSIKFQERMGPLYAAVREKVSILSGLLGNNLSGIATVKSYTAEPFEVERVREASLDYREANRAAITLSSAFSPLIRMLIVIGFTVTLVYGGFLVIDGQLDVAIYSTLIFMTQRLLWPLTRLGNTLDMFQRAMASTTRVLDLLDTKSEIVSGPLRRPVEEVRGEVELENVTFAYSDGGRIIRDLSLHIPAGKSAAIVGPTGAGKSTVIKLLLRFYDVQKGSVCLDGIDVRKYDLKDLRRAMGLVSQDVYLFHGSVRENIAYGSFDASDEAIVRAAKIAEAHDFIIGLPNGYDTIVGERGQKLSGGQRQRISIARAVLRDPPVLILDEATSSVDNETEAAIQRSLDHIAIGRTTIVIAHRLSTVRNADIIFVLENGRLKEEGRHEELLAADGIYASLWRVQTGERPVIGIR